MALQKILYFADGEYLAQNHRPLFDDRIEAWDYGPVVPNVYHEFKRFGKEPIEDKATSLDVNEGLSTMRFWTPEIPVSEDAVADRLFLDKVWGRYGQRSAIELMRESHREDGPWWKVRSEEGREISPNLMFDFFSSHQH